MAGEVLDRRAALEEAFESAEADERGEVYTPPVRETPEPKEEGSNFSELTPEPDPGTTEQKAADKVPPKDKQRTKGVPPSERKPTVIEKGPGTVTAAEVDPNAPVVSALDKAPTSWGVQRDALWAKVPSEVRAIINKRETEIQKGMSQAGRATQIAEEYVSLIKPYENTIRNIGTTPKEAINSVMQTATMMIVGTQEQKAAILTEMIQRYNVDLPVLDAALSKYLEGKGKNPNPTPQPQNQPMDPRIIQQLQPLFALQQRLEQQEGMQQQRLQTAAAEAINSVQAEPYFEDVRDDMADIMEISAKRGVVLTIKQAYDKAVQINPEVSKLVGQKTKQLSVSAAASTLARARRAASTVKGAPGASALKGTANDRRSAIEAAWDSN